MWHKANNTDGTITAAFPVNRSYIISRKNISSTKGARKQASPIDKPELLILNIQYNNMDKIWIPIAAANEKRVGISFSLKKCLNTPKYGLSKTKNINI